MNWSIVKQAGDSEHPSVIQDRPIQLLEVMPEPPIGTSEKSFTTGISGMTHHETVTW
jgi:hypothetical protein